MEFSRTEEKVEDFRPKEFGTCQMTYKKNPARDPI